MKVLILAGGFATRLWPLTEKTAKPLILLAGKPMISWIVERVPERFEIIISTNAVFAESFETWKRECFPNRSIKIFVEDSKNEEGKKGALFATALVIRELNLGEDLFLIAGDNYFGFSLEKFLENFASVPDAPLLAAYDIGDKEKAKGFGVVVPDQKFPDQVKSFQEKPDEPLSTLVSTGCFVFPRRVLPLICEYAESHRDDLGKIFEYLLGNGEMIRLFSFREEWFDIGSFSAYLEANKLLLADSLLAEGQTEISSDSRVSGAVFLGKNTKLLSNVVIEDSVVLEGCRLENCEIRNSVIGKNVLISGVDCNQKIIREESVLIR